MRTNSRRYYWRSLAAIHGTPALSVGEDLYGLPVVWVEAGGRRYGATDLNLTLALRRALQQALQEMPRQVSVSSWSASSSSAAVLEKKEPLRLRFPHHEETPAQTLKSALQVMKRSGAGISVLDLALEPFLAEGPVEVACVLLREEVSP
ncbi:hypothetical protein LJK88_49095 [Paenibacillus sp. P26]|nr:hypothetical protein LJK88_49095 [Paenibacillus sp. P26]